MNLTREELQDLKELLRLVYIHSGKLEVDGEITQEQISRLLTFYVRAANALDAKTYTIFLPEKL